MSKAFDRVNHKRLLLKIWNIGVRGNLHLLISSQSVRLNNCISTPIFVPSGVPQGSHLGPLLFCIYINDLVPRIKYANVLLYADDVKIYSTINSVSDTQHLQSDIDALSQWSVENELSLNISKCSVISFYKNKYKYHLLADYFINDCKLEIVEVVKDLGVLVGFIERTTNEFSDISVIIYLYKAIVIPNLLYCCQIWSPFTSILKNKLESIQHRFLRYIAFKDNRPMSRLDHNYIDVASAYSIQTVSSLHHYHDCLLTFKTTHNYFNSDALNNLFLERHTTYNLRNHRVQQEETPNSNFGFYSTVNQLKRSWNLPLT